MTCSTCEHFVKHPQDLSGKGGTCHRYPPTLVTMPVQAMQPGQMQLKQTAFYPPVKAADVCGEWSRKVQPDEN